jgi:predicted MFS family arabinose efflux permease
VGPEELANAVPLNSTGFNVARIIGPALGGAIIATLGIAVCYFINAASFIFVLVSIWLMRPQDFHVGHRLAKGNVLRQVGEGLRYAVTTPEVALVLLLLLMLGTFGYNFPVVLPLLAKFTLRTGPGGLGMLMTSLGIGSLIAALGMAYRGRASRRTLFAGASAFSVLLFLVAASPSAWITVPLLVLLGFASITFMATANTLLQLTAPPELRGRVMSLWALLFLGTTPIGSMIIGALSERYSVQSAVEGMALLCGLGVVMALVYLKRVRGARAVEAGA